MSDEAQLRPDCVARERVAKWVCIALCLVLLGHVWRSYGHWQNNARDEAVFWMAGERVAAGDTRLYEPPRDESNLIGIYIYPPAFAAFFAPLTWLERGVGRAIWAVLQVAFLVGCALVIARQKWMRSWQMGARLLLGLIWPIVGTIAMGQVNSLVLLLCLLAWHDSERDRPWRCGFWLALGLHVKILPFVLLGALVMQRKFKDVLAALMFAVLICVAPLPFYVSPKGFEAGVCDVVELHEAYMFQMVRPRIADQFAYAAGGESYSNFSISAQLDRAALVAGVEDRRVLRWVGFGVAGLLYALALWKARGARGETALLAWGLCMAAAVLGNLLAWPSHMVVFAMFMAPALLRSNAFRIGMSVFVIVYSVPAMVAYQAILPAWVFDTWVAAQGFGLATLMVVFLWVLAWLTTAAKKEESMSTANGMEHNRH